MDVEFIEELLGRMNQQYSHSMEQNTAMLTEFVNNLANRMNTSATTSAHVNNTGQKDLVGKIKNFDGSSDPKVINGFLAALQLKFAIKGVTDVRDKVMIFGSFLDDGAQMWYNTVVNEGYDNITYNDLVELFKQRYLPVRYAKNAKTKLKMLKQTKSVTQYIQDFTELASLVQYPYTEPVYLLDQFVEGLKPAVRVHVENQDPQTLQIAFELAQKTDNTVWRNRINYTNRTPTNHNSTRREPDAMELDELDTSSKKETRTCFYCKKPGHVIKDCRTRKEKESKNLQA